MIPHDNVQMRDAFIDRVYEEASRNPDIFFLSCEYGAPSLDRFRHELPEQFFNMGISEQNAISVAAGLALEGKKVFVYSIASFITLRCLEQVKIDLCTMQLPVTIVGVGPCYAYGVDGPTHHATEDIAIMSSMAHMTIYSPGDAQMASDLVEHALDSNGPVYCRLDKGIYNPLPQCNDDEWAQGLRVFGEGDDLALIATGVMVHRALEVAVSLKTLGISSRVIDLFRPKPIDTSRLSTQLENFGGVVCLEEHSTFGGIGAIMAGIIAASVQKIPYLHMAVQDEQLYAYGERSRLHAERHLDREGIVRSIVSWQRNLKTR